MYKLIGGVELMNKIQPIEWIWEPFIPRNCVSILSSRGGVGKSGFALWLADTLAGEGKKVIYLDAEDLGCQFRSRYDTWNLPNLDLVQFVESTENPNTTTSPKTVVEIYELVKDSKPDLVILDSFTILSSSFDANRRDQVTQFYRELSRIAINCNTGILLLAHHKKKQSGEFEGVSIDSISGSGAVTDLSRSVMAMDFDRNNKPDGRIIIQTKFNLTRKSKPLTFRITDNGIVDVKLLDPIEPTSRATESKADKFRTIAVAALKEGLSKKAARQLLKESLASPVECGRALDWASSQLHIEWEGEL